ncbi:MAG: energy transducer TonB, partial [Pseudolabrys sp.]
MIDVSLERADLRLWVASAAVILALHASAGLLLLNWHDPLTGDEGTEPIVVDLAPFTGPSAGTKSDLAPGPEQQQAAPVPEQQPK